MRYCSASLVNQIHKILNITMTKATIRAVWAVDPSARSAWTASRRRPWLWLRAILLFAIGLVVPGRSLSIAAPTLRSVRTARPTTTTTAPRGYRWWPHVASGTSSCFSLASAGEEFIPNGGESTSAGASTDTAAALRTLTVRLDRSRDPDLLCELLMELGACSASLTDAYRNTSRETAIFGEPRIGTLLGGAHYPHQVWDVCNVTAHFPDSADLERIVATVQDVLWNDDPDDDNSPEGKVFDAMLRWDVQVLPDRDWVVHVQQSWKPLVEGRFVVALPWHTDSDVQQALQQAAAKTHSTDTTHSTSAPPPLELKPLTLYLEGGIAFGTGEHATTQLCLHWIDDVVSEALRVRRSAAPSPSYELGLVPPPLRVLDYGSGSGILGLAACALGREETAAAKPGTRPRILVEAIGIDLDVDACRIANANARQNNDLPMRNFLPPLGLLHRDDGINDDDEDHTGVDTTTRIDTTNNPAMDAESKSLLLKAHRQAELFRRPPLTDDDDDDNGNNSYDPESLILPTELDQEQFPIVVANILAGPLIALAPTLLPRVAPGGKVGLSGVLSHQATHVAEVFRREGLENVRVSEPLGDWVLITGTKRR